MNFHAILVRFALLTTIIGTGLRAQADTIPPGDEALTYNVALNDGVSGVSDILFLNALTVPEPGFNYYYTLAPGKSSVTQFWPTSYPAIIGSLGVGLVTNLPGDPSGGTTTHLAVFGNFAVSEIGQSFSTLFPGVNENTLINDLANNNSNAFFNDFVTFYNDAANRLMFIPAGGNFDVVAFTDGQLIGTGTLDVTSPVPEPGSLGLVALGLAGLVRTVQRRRSANREITRPPTLSRLRVIKPATWWRNE
jgi:hypothetical protein